MKNLRTHEMKDVERDGGRRGKTSRIFCYPSTDTISRHVNPSLQSGTAIDYFCSRRLYYSCTTTDLKERSPAKVITRGGDGHTGSIYDGR